MSLELAQLAVAKCACLFSLYCHVLENSHGRLRFLFSSVVHTVNVMAVYQCWNFSQTYSNLRKDISFLLRNLEHKYHL